MNEKHKLVDSFGRRIDYLRLSVTDRCDLRCMYCLPNDFRDFEPPEHWLTFAEIQRIVRMFTSLGTRRVRLTGGEPLLRKDLAVLATQLSAIPKLTDLSLSTNGTRLEQLADVLRRSGISRLNVSLDSLRPARFRTITGGKLEKVQKGLMAAKRAGFPFVKINMVVMKNVNDDEIEEMVTFCMEHSFTLRFIETMPLGDTGRAASDRYVNLDDIYQRLTSRFELVPDTMFGGGPARYARIAGTEHLIGFITPLSRHFCATCNRVRLSVDGTLHTCLGQEHSLALRPLLRTGINDTELKQRIIDAIALKPERHEFHEHPRAVVRFSSMIGG